MSGIRRSPRHPTSGTEKIGGDHTSQTSLDRYITKLAVSTGSVRKGKRGKTWSKKQKRAYQRSLSGIKVADILGKPLRLMSLTTAKGASQRRINRDFEILKKRIRRKYGVFEYFKVRTNEGYGVLHILYRGTYIPHKWLSKTWDKIHRGSYIVDIRLVRLRKKRLARYLVTQYIAGHSFTRMSWSWKWVFKAFVRVWKSVIKRCRGETLEKILIEWKKILSQHCYKQKSIYDYLSKKPPPNWRLVNDWWWRGSKKHSSILKGGRASKAVKRKEIDHGTKKYSCIPIEKRRCHFCMKKLSSRYDHTIVEYGFVCVSCFDEKNLVGVNYG